MNVTIYPDGNKLIEFKREEILFAIQEEIKSLYPEHSLDAIVPFEGAQVLEIPIHFTVQKKT